jgi:Rrf2 family protein
MSHISVAVEYALHCLVYLIGLPDDAAPPSAKDLAALRELPVRYVATIMTKLQKGGIVITAEGVRGGIRLARPAAEISFHDVIVAVDGDKTLFACRDVRHACALFTDGPPPWATSGVCSIHAVMLEAEARMKDVLKRRTLVDIAEQACRRVPADFRAASQAWLQTRTQSRKASAA